MLSAGLYHERRGHEREVTFLSKCSGRWFVCLHGEVDHESVCSRYVLEVVLIYL